ncbi:MAG: Zinc/iron permease [Monoraphidium minutum]|nr:MAG: Zinc/iron permease [Monoraphidium minutum]
MAFAASTMLMASVALLLIAGTCAAQGNQPAGEAPAAAPAAPAPAHGGGLEVSPKAVGIAFGLVFAAGLCAPLGACAVFFLNAERHFHMLPASLALAAGVMIFISIYEVLQESAHHFRVILESEALIQLATMGSFFLGVPVCSLLDWVTDKAMLLVLRPGKGGAGGAEMEVDVEAGESEDGAGRGKGAARGDSSGAAPPPPAAPASPAAQAQDAASGRTGPKRELLLARSLREAAAAGDAVAPACPSVSAAIEAATNEHCRQLLRTSFLVSLALAVHNMPEGLATFVGYVSAPSTGVLIAIAIAAHNIPEGICIGVPVFFATGSRWRAVMWAAVSGLTEPLGAVLGLVVLKTGAMDDTAMGIIMGLVAGVMTSVAFGELIPRALAYDRRRGRFTYWGIMAGIAVMAASIVLLGLWE